MPPVSKHSAMLNATDYTLCFNITFIKFVTQ